MQQCSTCSVHSEMKDKLTESEHVFSTHKDNMSWTWHRLLHTWLCHSKPFMLTCDIVFIGINRGTYFKGRIFQCWQLHVAVSLTALPDGTCQYANGGLQPRESLSFLKPSRRLFSSFVKYQAMKMLCSSVPLVSVQSAEIILHPNGNIYGARINAYMHEHLKRYMVILLLLPHNRATTWFLCLRSNYRLYNSMSNGPESTMRLLHWGWHGCRVLLSLRSKPR